jgi:hypothetical protein
VQSGIRSPLATFVLPTDLYRYLNEKYGVNHLSTSNVRIWTCLFFISECGFRISECVLQNDSEIHIPKSLRFSFFGSGGSFCG